MEPYQPKGEDDGPVPFWRDAGDLMAPIPLREQIYPFGGELKKREYPAVSLFAPLSMPPHHRESSARPRRNSRLCSLAVAPSLGVLRAYNGAKLLSHSGPVIRGI